MQIQCVICSDLITQTAIADVIGLACGHIFHGLCIRTWLERSATCPHCRAKATGSKQYKVYLTIAPEPEGQDVVTLTRTVDNLKYELKLKNMECSTLAKEVDTYKTRSSGLVKEVRKLEANIASVAEVTMQLNEQRKFANNKAKQLSQAKFIIESLENELQQYQTLKAMVNNKSMETDSGIDIKSLDSSQLTFLLNTFKKDTLRLSKLNEDIKKTLSKTETEKMSMIKKNQELQESVYLKDRVIESLKESLAKNKEKQTYLKKKLKEVLCGSHSENAASLDITSTESQTSSFSKVKEEQDKFSNLDESVRQKEALQCELAEVNVVLNTLPAAKPTFRITSDRLRGIDKLNSFLKPSLSSDGFSYDGMGGHSKEGFFPSAYRSKLGMAKISKVSFKKKKL